jgi:hypothetical protein
MSELGRIERLDPRTHWRDEARDFTPWLRNNIDLLGEALGLEIDPTVDSEVSVGSFSADLLCTDLGSGALILVENQLEATDHSHLGQLLTYTSGLDARVVVWVARQFRDEHGQALTWLNENTLEDVKFFGVEVELVQIGASARAPNFKVLVAPSEWQKSGATARSVQATDRQQKYRDFWGSLISAIHARDPRFTSSRPDRAPKQNWCSFSAGAQGFQDNAVFGWEAGGVGNLVKAELYIDTGDKERNKAAFDLLAAERDSIEREFGESLTWTRRDDIRASRIYVAMPGSINDPEEILARHRAWLVDRILRIRKVFGPRIKSLSLG